MAGKRKRGAGRPVDLARERRIRAAMDRVSSLLEGNPALAERTRQALAGELGIPDLEEDEMANDEQVVLRLPAAMVARVEALVVSVGADPAVTSEGNVRVNRSAVLRMALARGLDALEMQYPPASSRPRKK